LELLESDFIDDAYTVACWIVWRGGGVWAEAFDSGHHAQREELPRT